MPPEWKDMSAVRRIWEGLGGPVVWGVVCGFLLVVSAPLYILGAGIGVLGGIVGGAQHATLRGASARATVGGVLFGLSILFGYALNGGQDAKVHIPDPQILLLSLTLLPAYPLHWLGWRIAGSRRGRGSE